MFVYITLFFLKIKQNVNIKPKHLKLIQMHLQMCTQNICMRSWKMALAFAFAFESSEAIAYKCVYMHLLTSLILRLAEKAYNSKQLSEKRGNSKETWVIVKTIHTVRNKHQCVNYPIHLMHGDRNISNKRIWQMNLLKKLMLVLTYQRTSQIQMFL